MTTHRTHFKILFAAATLGGCAGSGPLAVTAYGEDYIEQRIPADAFEDGWTATFDKFLIVLASVEIADAAGAVAGAVNEPKVFDMTKPGPVDVADFGEVAAQRWDEVSVVVAPADGATAATASAEDVTLMKEGGYSVYVEGSANDATRALSFSWGFTTATENHDCETEGEGAGIVVRAGEENTAQLTVHGDHLFYDDLASADAVLRFDAIAAADGALDGGLPDNVISLSELDGVDLTTLPEGQYGNAGAAETLGAFIAELTRTLVHFNGEGHCAVKAL